METIYKKDYKEFLKVKSQLDGCIFWRKEGDKVEIKIVLAEKELTPIVQSLKN